MSVHSVDQMLITPYKLPPMPVPDHSRRWNQAKCGTFNVLLIIGLVLAVTHGIALNPRIGSLPQTAYWVCFGIIHTSAFLAIICLERVLRADPGVIMRSRDTCTPIPDAVRERLERGEPLDDLRNIYLDDDSRGSYCVRCCVWRPPQRHCHHCSTCQRCVIDFDHHCGFYGRCIAGTSRTGNMPYFFALIILGWTSAAFVFAFVAFALVNGPQ